MIDEPYRSLYSILLRCRGKVIECKKVGEQYLVITERPVETENMATGEISQSVCTQHFLLSPTYTPEGEFCG